MSELAIQHSGIMVGRVWHKRYLPREHAFFYRVFYGLFDLDELPALEKRSRFFSLNRRNLFSLWCDDYGLDRGPHDGSLKARIAGLIKSEFETDISRVELLTMPRVFGYAFNPISIYYCYGPQNCLSHVIYEVNNTFGERFSYAFAVEGKGGKLVPHTCHKQLHVSPFFEVSGGYSFRQSKDMGTIKLAIDYRTAAPASGASPSGSGSLLSSSKKAFSASMSLEKIDFSGRNLLLTSARIPFVTAKVIAAIHWQALLLLLKKHRVFGKPAAPVNAFDAQDSSSKGSHV